ncbi:hypothetical protein RL72_03304 [Microbacterium azadirachtae]|uniref:Uncharacterized protein n=1 Tax=Microbacterium azadirachtae TaxID=582680 RepID=A0A0F0KD48_9MICO|nr:hypothetical protein [Microbacterium azadirachtae]KJL18832.1 hypothetical protein RL72_03304 [Microbacterium azadirachtae]
MNMTPEQPVRISEAELKNAFAYTHRDLDPADLEEMFRIEQRVDAVLEASPDLRSRLGDPDPHEFTRIPVLEEAGNVVRAALREITQQGEEERLDDATLAVLNLLEDADALSWPVTERHAHNADFAMDTARALLLAAAGPSMEFVSCDLLEQVADTIASMLPLPGDPVVIE